MSEISGGGPSITKFGVVTVVDTAGAVVGAGVVVVVVVVVVAVVVVVGG